MRVVQMQAKGAEDVVRVAFARFEDIASERGWTVRVENPGDLPQGGDRFEIELPIIDDEKSAHLAVQAAIDEVPGGDEVFTFA
jgi:hypothetical protein